MTIGINQSIAPTSILTGSVGLGSAASANYETDTPTNAVKVLEAGAEGARITRAEILVRGTTVATRVILFRGSDAAGTAKRRLRSRNLTAYSTGVTTEPTNLMEQDFGYSELSPLLLGPNESLWAAQTVAQTGSPIVVNAEGGKYNP